MSVDFSKVKAIKMKDDSREVTKITDMSNNVLWQKEQAPTVTQGYDMLLQKTNWGSNDTLTITFKFYGGTEYTQKSSGKGGLEFTVTTIKFTNFNVAITLTSGTVYPSLSTGGSFQSGVTYTLLSDIKIQAKGNA